MANSRAGLATAPTLLMPRIQATQMVEIELSSDRDQIVGQHQPGSSEAPAPSHVGASVGSGVLNMSNTILGAGMLALPHALAQSGLLVGLLLLALFAALSLLGLHLLSAAADLAGRPSSFYAVVRARVRVGVRARVKVRVRVRVKVRVKVRISRVEVPRLSLPLSLG